MGKLPTGRSKSDSPKAPDSGASWWAVHGSEVLRGAILGLALGILFCYFAWEPSPNPQRGDLEQSVVARFGEPDEVRERVGHKLPEGMIPVRQLVYHNGLFNLSTTIIAINPNNGRVMSVTADADM